MHCLGLIHVLWFHSTSSKKGERDRETVQVEFDAFLNQSLHRSFSSLSLPIHSIFSKNISHSHTMIPHISGVSRPSASPRLSSPERASISFLY